MADYNKRMALDPRRIEVMDEEMAAMERQRTPAQRIKTAHDMWRYARARLQAAVQWQHPDWSEREIDQEVGRRMLHGSK